MSGYELYIGNLQDASDGRKLGEEGVDSVLKLTYTDPDDGYPETIEVHEFSMRDGPQNDERVFDKQPKPSCRSLRREKQFSSTVKLASQEA